MTVNIKCPHCTKDITLTVANGGQPSEQKPFIESKASDTIRKPAPQSTVPLVDTQQAKQMRSKINIEGTVTKKGETRTLNKKAGGQIDTCDAFLTDNAGEIKTQFWGDEVNQVQNGMKIRITNGYTNSFKGEISLTKGKYGNMEILS